LLFSLAFHLMIAKLCATWLVVLVLSPFTAPFSTCDLANPLHGPGRGAPFAPRVAAASIDTNSALVPGRILTGRSKLIARPGHHDRARTEIAVQAAPVVDTFVPAQRQAALHTILRL